MNGKSINWIKYLEAQRKNEPLRQSVKQIWKDKKAGQ